MTVKNLLAYIAIEIEAGRLTGDEEIKVFGCACTNGESDSIYSSVIEAEVDGLGLCLNF